MRTACATSLALLLMVNIGHAQGNCPTDVLYKQCPSYSAPGYLSFVTPGVFRVFADRFTMSTSAHVSELQFWATEPAGLVDTLTVHVELFSDRGHGPGARLGNWRGEFGHGLGNLTAEPEGYAVHPTGWHDLFPVLRYSLPLAPAVLLGEGELYWIAIYWEWESDGFALRVSSQEGMGEGTLFGTIGWRDPEALHDGESFALIGERLSRPPPQPCPPIRPGPDCNHNGVDDSCDLRSGRSVDCNGDGVPDDCAYGTDLDCDGNSLPDTCDIAAGRLADCNENGVADICEPGFQDCNRNSILDQCEIDSGTVADCNGNGVPDPCEEPDVNGNNVPDECEPDCNRNTVPDAWELRFGWVPDRDADGVPDRCQCPGDVNEDGWIDQADLYAVLAEFGSPAPGYGDRDWDGDVDLDDLNAVLAAYATNCP